MISIRTKKLCLVLFFLFPVTAMAVPTLKSDSNESAAGYYQLHWSNNHAGDFVLQESSSPDFSSAELLYQGPDTATLVSGRKNGTYFYRVRSADDESDWSNSVKVNVTHHPLSRAFMFFSLGALVFVATLTMVIRGNLAHRPTPD